MKYCQRFFWCLILGSLLPLPIQAQSFDALTPGTRKRIDTLAMQTPDPKSGKTQIEAYGTILAWLTAQTPMTAKEEAERATEAHQEILRTKTIATTPPKAQQIFSKLVDQLPRRLRPDPFRFTLTVIDNTETRAFTVGAGYLYITKPYLNSLLADKQHGADRLAFLLAREIGHVCREDCRLGFRFLRLEEELGSEVETNRVRWALETSVAVTGKLVKFAYSPKQEARADLFALHLCRNAGFNTETSLDILRSAIITQSPAILNANMNPASNSKDVKKLLRRLKHLRMERDGIPTIDSYGLHEFNPRDQTLSKLENHSVNNDERTILFIHGMESDLNIYLPMMKRLAASEATQNVRILGFRYPDDGSLARSGKFLKREIDRACTAPDKIDFVCHSAGGLVFRYYAEIEKGKYSRALFQGTPHAGSNLALLRPILEAKQFFGDLKLGYSQSFEQAILDGSGQITYDLQTNSLFLNYLNRNTPRADRYYIIRGQAMSPLKAALFTVLLDSARRAIKRDIEQSEKPELSRRQMQHWIDLLDLPEEVTNGDLAVTLSSAELQGAADIKTFPTTHGELPRHPDVMNAVTEILEKTP